jgi:hypothetical protein
MIMFFFPITKGQYLGRDILLNLTVIYFETIEQFYPIVYFLLHRSSLSETIFCKSIEQGFIYVDLR